KRLFRLRLDSGIVVQVAARSEFSGRELLEPAPTRRQAAVPSAPRQRNCGAGGGALGVQREGTPRAGTDEAANGCSVCASRRELWCRWRRARSSAGGNSSSRHRRGGKRLFSLRLEKGI